jgi:hypothetical protein
MAVVRKGDQCRLERYSWADIEDGEGVAAGICAVPPKSITSIIRCSRSFRGTNLQLLRQRWRCSDL